MTRVASTSKMPRPGRPPRVNYTDENTAEVTVRGTRFTFRNGRPVGENRDVRGSDYEYAKALVKRTPNTEKMGAESAEV